MEIPQLLSAIANGEGQSIEFKTSFAEQDEAIKALCAFINAYGGSVFIGVGDDGSILGVTMGQNTIENFTNKLRSSTQPPLSPKIEQLNVEGKIIAVASIGKADEGALFYAFNIPYIRIGKTNQVMTPTDIKERLYKGFQKENLASKAYDAFDEIKRVKVVRTKQGIPDYLSRLKNGREIIDILGGCYAGSFDNDDLFTQSEIDLIGSFF